MKNKITVQGVDVAVKRVQDADFLSLTDMLKAKDGEFFVKDWLRNRNTLEFIGYWEAAHNPDFKWGEFALLANKSGLNSFKISVEEFVSKTNSICIISRKGNGGGTFAHQDIALEFGMWISPQFKVYLIKEYQRLKVAEQEKLQWSARRELAKINYALHTDAIKENLIVPTLTDLQRKYVYTDEADMLNVALFGHTAAQWRAEHPHDAKQNLNVRDLANIHQLLVLANMESYNAQMIKDGVEQCERIQKLNDMARYQLPILMQANAPLLKN